MVTHLALKDAIRSRAFSRRAAVLSGSLSNSKGSVSQGYENHTLRTHDSIADPS